MSGEGYKKQRLRNESQALLIVTLERLSFRLFHIVGEIKTLFSV